MYVLTHYKCRRRRHIFFLFAECCGKVSGGYTYPSLQIVCIPVRRHDTDLLRNNDDVRYLLVQFKQNFQISLVQ